MVNGLSVLHLTDGSTLEVNENEPPLRDPAEPDPTGLVQHFAPTEPGYLVTPAGEASYRWINASDVARIEALA